MLMIAIRCFVQYVVILACYAALPQFKPPLRERYLGVDLGVHVGSHTAGRRENRGNTGEATTGAYGARRGSRRGTWRRFVGRDAFDDDGYYRI
jgi:hypothetical protein